MQTEREHLKYRKMFIRRNNERDTHQKTGKMDTCGQRQRMNQKFF